jgi:hypothetical protein
MRAFGQRFRFSVRAAAMPNSDCIYYRGDNWEQQRGKKIL